MSDKNKKITYKPDFSYEKDYSTIGAPVSTSSETGSSQDSSISSKTDNSELLSSIMNKIQSIRSMCRTINLDIMSIINKSIYGIMATLPYIDTSAIYEDEIDENKGILAANRATNTGSAASNNNVEDDERKKITALPLPTHFGIKNNVVTQLKIKTPKKYTIVDAFDHTVLYIYDDFLSRLQDRIKTYNLNVMMGSQYGGLTNLSAPHTTHTSEVDTNLQHMADSIVRSEILYDQKLRLTEKMFDSSIAINHFNALYVSKVFSERYNEEKPQKDNTQIGEMINKSLDATKALYESKYYNNLTNFYKYYYSCSDFIGECLDYQSSAFIAKNIINKDSDKE